LEKLNVIAPCKDRRYV